MTFQQPDKKPPSPNFVVRSSKQNFTIIANSALRDPRLSYRAKGILAACLTHSETFVFDKAWILAHGTEGRDAVVAALKELRHYGYLRSCKGRDAAGRLQGERYVVSDEPPMDHPPPTPPAASLAILPPPADPSASALPPGEQLPDPEAIPAPWKPGALETRRPEKPDAGKPGRHSRKPIERTPTPENQSNPPVAPLRGEGRLQLPDWLEPHRCQLERWQALRAKVHPKLPRGITDRSLKALLYASQLGVLEDFCELAGESAWQSLGFNGHRAYIDKILQDRQPQRNAKPAMAPIRYTLL
jgi:hypothetical protein